MNNALLAKQSKKVIQTIFKTRAQLLFSSQATITDTNVEVQIGDHLEKFPVIWLKDNCTCQECTFTTRSRLINWNQFNLDSTVKELKTENEAIKIKWDDGHESVYSFDWLKKRSFSYENKKAHLRSGKPEKKFWGKNDFQGILKCYQFDDVITNDEVFYNWLMDLAIYGVALIKNAPLEERGSEVLIKRAGFSRRTHYGRSFYVRSKSNANNQAYLSNELQLHIDLPFYDYRPGVQMLHCLVQTKTGGASLLADGFYAANELKKQNKKYFNILSKTYVNWRDEGEEDNCFFNKKHRLPVIGLNQDGELEKITHNIAQRDSVFSVNIDIVSNWYRALKAYIELLYKDTVEFKLEPRDIIIFDNMRLLHGRRAYNDTEGCERLLIGNYLDWDEIYCKLRVVKKMLNK